MQFVFGSFTLDLERRNLWRDGQVVKLSAKEFATLAVLVESNGTAVESDVLLAKVWGSRAVDPNNLPQQIRALRKKIGKDAEGQDYIRTIQNGGYVFIGARMSSDIPEAVLAEPLRRSRKRLWVAAGSLAIACVVTAWMVTDRVPTVTRVQQITTDGHPKTGPLLVDGASIYFHQWNDGWWKPATVAASGGAGIFLDLPVRLPMLFDVLNGRFLLSGRNDAGEAYLWEWIIGQSPRALIRSGAEAAAWMDESTIVTGGPDPLTVHGFREGAVKRLTSVPDAFFSLVWSPVNRNLRMGRYDRRSEVHSIWELRNGRQSPTPLMGAQEGFSRGRWTPGGDFFFMQGPGRRGGDLWAFHDRGRLFGHRHRQPFSLTAGPRLYSWPAPAPDGRRVFVIGETTRAELARYNATAGIFEPWAGGPAGVEADCSRDGQWVAYSSYPDRKLWITRPDGTGRKQLTFDALVVSGPHWSPDGREIAFMGESVDKKRQVYLIPASGGIPRAASPQQEDQGIPTWSPDGKRLMFGQLLLRGPQAEMRIFVVDLESKALEELPNSRGVWTPRWSPDGRLVAGLTPDYGKLLVYDFQNKTWQEAVSLENVDDPGWSRDSRFINFRANDGQGQSIFQFDVVHKTVKRLVNLREAEHTSLERWFGVAPDGSPLGMTLLRVQDVYAFELKY